MAFAETANLAVKLTLGGNFTSQLAKARAGLRGLEKESRGFKAGAQIGTGIKRSFLLVGAGASLAAVGIAKAIGAAGDFEAQLNTINTIARATPEALGKIGDSVRQIARDTGTPLEDLTKGYYDLLSAGIKTADAQNVLVQSNKLAIGGLSTTAEAIDLLTTAINTYGGDASQAAKDADIFAKAVERGKVTAAEIAGSFATVGPLAAAYGVSIDEIGAAYARLTASGVPAAEAATQMRAAIQSLAKPDKALRALEASTHKNYLGIAGKQGLVVALQQMRDDAQKAGIPLSLLTSRIEAMQFLLQTTGPNFAAYQADLKAMGDASGTAGDQMAERQKGLNFQLARLGSLANDAGITIGSALLPKLTPLVEKLNAFINSNQGGIAAFGQSIADLFSDSNIAEGGRILGDVMTTAKQAAPVIADAARLVGSVMATAVKAFMSLPSEIQALAIGGFALNKLTGGLVTNIAGGIFGALKAMTVQAAVVNVTGGVVNGGGGIPGGVPAGGGLLTSLGLTTATLLPLTVGLIAAAGLGSVLDAAILKAGGLVPASKQLTNQGLTLGTSPSVKDPTKFVGQNTFLGGKGGGLVIMGSKEVPVAVKNWNGLEDRLPARRIAQAGSPMAIIDRSSVAVTVNVTAGGIKKTVTSQSRYGPAAGSRDDPRFLGYTPGI